MGSGEKKTAFLSVDGKLLVEMEKLPIVDFELNEVEFERLPHEAEFSFTCEAPKKYMRRLRWFIMKRSLEIFFKTLFLNWRNAK